MKIKKIINQKRRVFTAVYQCEHCNYKEEMSGYDDYYFYIQVIPKFHCKKCKKTALKAPKKEDIKLRYHEYLTI